MLSDDLCGVLCVCVSARMCVCAQNEVKTLTYVAIVREVSALTALSNALILDGAEVLSLESVENAEVICAEDNCTEAEDGVNDNTDDLCGEETGE